MDYEVGDTHEVEVRTPVPQLLFCKISGECGEKKIFHRKIQRNSYKNSPFSALSTLKDAGALRWKKFFFHRYSPLILHYFWTKTRPGPGLAHLRYHTSQVEVPSGSDLWSDQVQLARCVPRPKLQGLGFGSSAQWYDQRSLRSGDGMIRGHFVLGMVWSEVTSVWEWYDRRSLRSGDGMIRGHFGLGMVWSEVTSGWEWSEQRRSQAHISLIRDNIERKIFNWFSVLFYRAMLVQPRGNKKQHSDRRHT